MIGRVVTDREVHAANVAALVPGLVAESGFSGSTATSSYSSDGVDRVRGEFGRDGAVAAVSGVTGALKDRELK